MAERLEMIRGKNMKKPDELVITRVFDAPVGLVWKMWTDPENVKRWWGPKGFTSPECRMDFRVGGKSVFCMQSQLKEFSFGKKFWSTGTYKEIVPLKKIVYLDSFADESGNVVPATHYGMSKDFPMELQVTITFEEQGGKTKMTLRQSGMPAGPDSEGANHGWNQSFDKLAEALKEG